MAVDNEEVYKINLPRSDLKLTFNRAAINAFMRMTSWASVTTGTLKEAMVTGELVVFEDEVNLVISAALDSGLDVTALHNNFLFDNPLVMFLHIVGEGNGTDATRGMRKCLDTIKEIRTAAPMPSAQFPSAKIPENSKISAQPIDKILGLKGQSNSGMYKAVIERHSRLAFAGTDDNALAGGELSVTIAKLQTVLRTLRRADINIVAIDNHMTHEEPQFVFPHYWARGSEAKLAKALRTGLDKQALGSGTHIGRQAAKRDSRIARLAPIVGLVASCR